VSDVPKGIDMNTEYSSIPKIEENNYKKLLKHYKFNDTDASLLFEISAITVEHIDELIRRFYEFIFEFDHARMFLHNKEILTRHEKGIRNWYMNLFCGEYNQSYFEKLQFISEIHVRIGLPAHYVNTAFSFVRGFVKELIVKEKRYEVLSAWDKIIDINLDMLTIAYREEEQSKLLDEIVLLKNAVESKQILPHVQAIVNTQKGNIEKYECLMRLKDSKQQTYVSVFPYLKTAKRIKLYEKMMRIMLDKSFKMFSNKQMEFSLNLSYEDISNSAFIEYLYKKVGEFDKPSNIIFEILETDFIEDFSVVEKFTQKIRTFGCKIAIDDFGSGYSSMENILKLKPEIIKIDGSLIKDIDKSSESITIVRNIINMAKELKAKTVAEYVHSKDVYELVKKLGVDYVQGFYLHKPMAFV